MAGIISDILFTYDTIKVVQVKSSTIGLVFRLIQLLIIIYIIGYVIIYSKGYQDTQPGSGVVVTKLKGLSYPTFTDDPLYKRVWDVADYMYPAQEQSSFFVITNAVLTPTQKPGVCPEDPWMIDVLCDCEAGQECDQCPAGTHVFLGNGVRTGKCVVSRNASQNVCEIHAWCPVENDELPTKEALLGEAKEYTVFIKNSIEFSQFNFKKRNIIDSINNEDYLKTCRFNAKHEIDRFCPIFKLGDIVRDAGENFAQMAIDGGIIEINIDWTCNLDNPHDWCRPRYSFARLDDPETKISSGFNFRYANHYSIGDEFARNLVKAYGIRFDINVRGTASKFSLIPLVTNIGTGLALLAVANVICDFLILKIHRKKEFYQEHKYEILEESSGKGDDNSNTGYGALDEVKPAPE